MTAVVVTGIGVIAPNGRNASEFWSATLSGRTGIGPLTRFDATSHPAVLAGQIDGFDPVEQIPRKLLPQTDVSTQFALAAAAEALADANVDPARFSRYGTGVVTSNATGGFAFTHREFQKLWTQGPGAVSVYESFAWFYAVNTGQISIRHGLRGPGCVLVSEQAGGLDAIGNARRAIRLGTPVMVTGGVDSSFDPWGWASHVSSGRLSRGRDPERAYLPFDVDANGYVPGEGGALLVLEEASSARARSARLYGEIAGYAATFDPRPGSSERPPGLRRAAELAVADAGLRPTDIDVVFADGSGVRNLDAVEAAALADLFGPGRVPVSAPKALTGRLYAGGGPLDVTTALLAIRDGVIPATAHTSAVPASYGLDLVLREPRRAELRSALVLARGKGGFNSAVVVRCTDG
ncbi:actinorhodin polyketide putative beta-ketoacyl synthase 2 [Longimycelium tulufanense]|uniref:Actinorhodin polyketide putative beta-ketoacyl synthase 2 n=1 Tax=Longimycelium tulufanense TaxID=907463 RepID=A0A8J3FU76_9PSEU|nr:ketosynthase chain-length factor [Longimycelium tulufanense]GGM52802.1 actinorhodin polyketide putative beta-ketoacyl synthase 2 [Longimycelium tulufanense]